MTARLQPPAAGTRFAALLRGINVGGKNTIAMPELCALFAELGHHEVVSYIQSGNLVFESLEADPVKVSREAEAALHERFGLTVAVLVRSRAELEAIAARSPFSTRGTAQHVVFLSSPAPKVETLDADRSPGDEFAVVGREIYVSYVNGSGRSKLTLDWFERCLGVVGTARNWNTLLKLIELTSA